MKQLATYSQRQRGAAAIEFALVFVLFFSVIYGAVTFGAVFYTQQVLSRAAEDGARAISLLGVTPLAVNDAQIKNIVFQSLQNSLIAPSSVPATQAGRRTWLENPTNVAVTVEPTCTGVSGCAKVTVQYQYSQNRILPVVAPFNTWIPATLTASAFAPK